MPNTLHAVACGFFSAAGCMLTLTVADWRAWRKRRQWLTLIAIQPRADYMSIADAVARMKTLAHEAKDADPYMQGTLRDEFNLVAICFDVPQARADGLWCGIVDEGLTYLDAEERRA